MPRQERSRLERPGQPRRPPTYLRNRQRRNKEDRVPQQQRYGAAGSRATLPGSSARVAAEGGGTPRSVFRQRSKAEPTMTMAPTMKIAMRLVSIQPCSSVPPCWDMGQKTFWMDMQPAETVVTRTNSAGTSVHQP